MIKEIIISASCLVIGGFVGYKVGVKKAQKFADEQVDSTKKALKNYYEKKLEEKDAVIKKTAEGMIVLNNDLGVDPGIDDADQSNSIKDPREQFPRVIEAVSTDKYTTIKKTTKDDLKDTKDSRKKDDVMKRPNDLPPTAIDTPDGYPDPEDENAAPYLIRDVDYGTVEGFEMQELILWECGTVTTDDSAHDVVSPTYLFKVLPEGWTKWFGWGERYLDSLYFRNNKEKKDIQISKELRTFREWLEENFPGRLGEVDED